MLIQQLEVKISRNMMRIEMKKNTCVLAFILIAMLFTGCQTSNTSQLQPTIQDLTNRLNTQSAQLTQVSSAINQPTATRTELLPQGPPQETVPPPPSIPTSTPAQLSGVRAPELIFSGSGSITPWSTKISYPRGLFAAANIHLLCDPNASTSGKIWIDNQAYTVRCPPNSESWYLWKQGITVGDHFIYSDNANDMYQFWTMGTTPFTIKNKSALSDYMFRIPQAGIYNLTANVTKGAFTLYITCEGAQNFNYPVSQSTTIQVVLNPARCELMIRNSPPETLTPGEIEVSLEFLK